MKRLGVAFLGEPAVPEMIQIAQYAESLGYESAWVGETRFTRDGFVPAAGIAASTKKIKISTGVVNVYTRNPIILATSYATLDELSGGRVIFGIGPGSPKILEPQGHSFTKPLTRLKEYIHVARQLIAGEKVYFEGETVNVQGVKLEFTPVRPSIPIYLGVTGEKAMEFAGEAADGVLMNGFTSCDYVRRSIERIRTGVMRTGRDISAIDRSIALVISMDKDAEVARNRVRPLIAMYMTLFPNIVQETGFSDEYVAEVQEAVKKGGFEEGAKHITEEVIDHLVVAGSPEHVRKRIGEYRDAGINCPVLSVLGPNVNEVLESVAGA